MKVIIDGENFRKGLASVLKSTQSIASSREILDYDVKGLLADILENPDLTVAYYASKIKLPNGHVPSDDVMDHVNKIREYTRTWVPALERQGIEYVKAGYLKVKQAKACRNCGESQEVLQEKGVDVKMANDIVEHAFTSPREAIIIFSSDSDLIPALITAKAKGVKLTYVCFAEYVNRAISNTVHETVSVSIEKAKRYFKSVVERG